MPDGLGNGSILHPAGTGTTATPPASGPRENVRGSAIPLHFRAECEAAGATLPSLLRPARGVPTSVHRKYQGESQYRRTNYEHCGAPDGAREQADGGEHGSAQQQSTDDALAGARCAIVHVALLQASLAL